MARTFTEHVVHEGKLTLKDWIKSQFILTTITLAGLLIGLNLIGIEHWILAAVAITIVDMLPVLGLSVTMIPWAVYELVFQKDTRTGLWIFLLFVIMRRRFLQNETELLPLVVRGGWWNPDFRQSGRGPRSIIAISQSRQSINSQ